MTMTFCVFLLTLSCPAFSPSQNAFHDVAYVAKYYGSSPASSFYQVYLCDRQGMNTACITNNTKNYGSVRWVNNNELALIEEGPQFDSLQIYNVKTQELTEIGRFGKADKPVLLVHPYVGTNLCLLRTGDIPYRYYSVDRTGTKPIASPPISAFRYTGGRMSFTANGRMYSLTQNKGNEPTTVVWTFAGESGSLSVYSEVGQGYFEAFQPKAKNQLWVNLWSGNERIGYRNDLLLLDFSRGKVSTIASHVNKISFHFDSRYWSGVSPYYHYQVLKDGARVRVNAGIVGDRTTGSRWTITSGLCHVRSISLPPGM